MKVLLLNPNVDAGHKDVKDLQRLGVALLLPENGNEAWQTLRLHGASVDLAIIHREGVRDLGEPGIELLRKIKKDAAQADLPVIITTSRWSDADCARHQDSPEGANAYLKFPFAGGQLAATIEAVLGQKLEEKKLPPLPGIAAPPPRPGAPDSSGGFVLEDVNSVFSGSHVFPTDTSIRLEAPVEATPPPAPMAPPPMTKAEETVAVPPPPVASAPDEISIPIAMDDGGTSAVLETSGAPAAAETPAPVEMTSLSLEMEEPPTACQMKPEPSLVMGSEPTTPLAPTPFTQSEVENEAEAAADAAKELPYLFSGRSGVDAEKSAPAPSFALPLGDAVVPGGAAQSPDTETLKKYLLLREQDVAALSAQLKLARERVLSVEDTLRLERGRSAELTHLASEHERKIAGFEREKQAAVETLQNEINDLKFQNKARVDKARLLEQRVREATEETERLKERVRVDIRKIRVREKELENRLEIMKKDSEALIGARENKIVELKRKLDLLEFNMDLLQDQYSREKETAGKLRERLAKAAQVVRLAGGLLDTDATDGEAPERVVEPRKAAS